MASTSVAVPRAASGRKYSAVDCWGGWRPCILACLGFSALFIALGLYMHAFAWSARIDASPPYLASHWRGLLLLERFVRGAAHTRWSAQPRRRRRTRAQ